MWLVGDRISRTSKCATPPPPRARSTAGGLGRGRGSLGGRQPGEPCGAGAACPATGVDHKYHTRRLLLAGKSLAPHANLGPLHRPPLNPITHPPGFPVPLPPPSPPGSPRVRLFKSPAPDSPPPSRDCAGTRGGESGSWVAAPASEPFSRNSRAPRPRPGGAGTGRVTSAPWRGVPDTCTLARGASALGAPSPARPEGPPLLGHGELAAQPHSPQHSPTRRPISPPRQ